MILCKAGPILEAIDSFHPWQAPLFRCAVRRRHYTRCKSPGRIFTANDTPFWFLRSRLKSGFLRLKKKKKLELNWPLLPRQLRREGKNQSATNLWKTLLKQRYNEWPSNSNNMANARDAIRRKHVSYDLVPLTGTAADILIITYLRWACRETQWPKFVFIDY